MNIKRDHRCAKVERVTTESSVLVEWGLDGNGQSQISTTIPFLDHMLTLLAKHGMFHLTVEAKGDTEIDDHHTVEDIGIVLGVALREAVGDKVGLKRFGWSSIPLDEALVQTVVDLSGRPYLVYNVELPHRIIKSFDLGLFEDFFQAFVNQGMLNLHVNVHYGRNPHHILEAIFKSLAKSLDAATTLDDRVSGVLSTKGSL